MTDECDLGFGVFLFYKKKKMGVGWGQTIFWGLFSYFMGENIQDLITNNSFKSNKHKLNTIHFNTILVSGKGRGRKR